jgi:hypothetical protein
VGYRVLSDLTCDVCVRLLTATILTLVQGMTTCVRRGELPDEKQAEQTHQGHVADIDASMALSTVQR